MVNLRSLSLCVLAGAFILSTASNAQQAATNDRLSAPARITAPIDENQLVTLAGNVHPAATAKNDRGPVSATLPMSGLVLVLSRSPEKQAAFDAYVESEYDSGSPNFHQWLTPDAIGEQYGPSQSDVATVTGWLAGHGFAVSQVSKDRLAITFSGTAGQVQSAFHTSIHNLSVNGKAHIANMSEPQIPAALAPVVVGVKQLHDFFPRPMHRVGSVVQFNQTAGKWQRTGSVPGFSSLHGLARIGASSQSSTSLSTAGPRPEFGLGGTSSSGPFFDEDVAPLDFATIYNVTPVWNESITGANQTIAIVGTSDICLGQSATPCSSNNDVSQFRSTFGLPAGVAPILDAGVNGHDPGICTGTTNPCNGDDLLENSLDVEWSGAVAPGAQIVLVTSGGTGTNDPITDDAQFIVDNHGSTSSTASIKDIANASIISISYGNCELGVGTANNVVYYHLWQQAASEGISVFIATGDSGAPACDEGGDSQNGNPYSAQFGLAVSGLASTPFNVAVGGTDFSWCKPTYNSQGNVVGCPASPSAAGPVWNASNNSSSGYESAAGYLPETPWNDSCMNPIWAAYVESLEPLTGFGTSPSNPEGACNYVQNEWLAIDQQQGGNFVLAGLIDTVGAGGGASNCVVNDIATDPNNPTCTANSTTTGTANGSIALTNNGWQKPSWQTGITPNDGVRDLPDVSFFAGDGALDSSTLVCVAVLRGSACSVGTGSISNSNSTTALEVGGTSVATPEMAGVMALINQKAGAPQGLPNKELYALAGLQTSATCSSETVTNTTAGCYFNDVDQGTIDMPCDNGASIGGATFDPQTGGWDIGQPIAGDVGLNCAALNSGDTVGSLVTSGTNVGYDAGVGYDLATGLGSLNVANVVKAWSSNAGTATATVAAQLSASTIAANVALTVTATVSGSSSTPTGTVTVTGNWANASGTLTAGVATITIPANTLAAGTDTLTVTYNGDATYASASTTATVTVTAVTVTGTFALSVPTAPTAVSSPGGSTTAAVKVTGSNGYAGTVTLSCALTQSPTGAVDSPTCTATSNSVTLNTTTTTGTVNFTIGTTAATSAQVDPASKNPKGWIGASGGAVLAFLVFLGVPSRRRSWRAMLGLVVLLASLGGLSACGGGSISGGGGGGGNPGTTTGPYTFTVTSAGSPAVTPAPTTTFTVTVN